MRIYLLILVAVFGFVQVEGQCGPVSKTEKPNTENKMPLEKEKFDSLPDGVKLTDHVREIEMNDAGQVVSEEIITVEEKLRKLGAHYVENILVDVGGKEIRFYRPPIRGASQGFDEDREQAGRDALELAELKEKYTVITIYIDPRSAL